MTLVTDAERLTALAEQAATAADASTTDAALRTVLERLELAKERIAFGVLNDEWWQRLAATDRHAVGAAAGAAKDAAKPLGTGADEVLAAYGRSDDASTRGALGNLGRAFVQFNSALQEAQDNLLVAWAEQIWPTERLAELDIHALVPETSTPANAVLSIRRGLVRDATDARKLNAEALRRRSDDVHNALRFAADLTQRPMPSAVLTFFQRITSTGEASLAEVTPDVLAWLRDHDATRLFTVGRYDA